MHIFNRVGYRLGCVFVIIKCFFTVTTAQDSTLQDNASLANEKLSLANAMLNSNPDSSYALYEELLPYFKQKKDTMNSIWCHIGYADVYKTRANYSNAYDHIWDALLLAENFGAEKTLTKIHMELASLYGIYDKEDEALHHTIKAFTIAKNLIREGKMKKAKLAHIYYALAVNHRKNEKFAFALAYLDSCKYSHQSPHKPLQKFPYIDAERGYIYLKLNKLDSAEFYLKRADEIFTKEDRSYQVVVNSFLGSLYIKKNNVDQAIKAFKKSIEMMQRFNTHTDMRAQVLLDLSEAYEKNHKTTLAYLHLKQAYSISDSIFNAKSNNNRQLFQIKNKYRETVKEKDEQIKQQHIVIERKNLIQSRLKILLGFILFVVIGVSVFVRMRYQLRKSGMEKKQLKLQALHVKEKADAVMEVKSRELTANTLQMIEKDRIVDELMSLLKKESPTVHKSMKLKINKGSKDMWEQFEKRFTEVNSNFYDHLRENHPNLTPTEQKHCALIKLNFDSKEMASLLNISLSSVHISRHRIRKKIGLHRDDNLSTYIANF